MAWEIVSKQLLCWSLELCASCLSVPGCTCEAQVELTTNPQHRLGKFSYRRFLIVWRVVPSGLNPNLISQDNLSWKLLFVHSPSKVLGSYLGLAWAGLRQHCGAFPLSSHLIDKTEELTQESSVLFC